jgi:drug/metabolite transporter (DMT)-like permease
VFVAKNKQGIAAGLLLAVFLWGANNSGIKVLVQQWPPVWVGATRFLCAGLLLLALLRWTTWIGRATPLSPELKAQLWRRGGVSLALYIAAFNWAVKLTTVSHVALYLGAAPVWALLWEGTAGRSPRELAQRYGAAALALTGVIVLFWPALKTSSAHLPGEVLGLTASVLWTHYGRQCRVLGAHLAGAEVTAHTMWRAGVLLLPLALVEVAARGGLVWSGQLLAVQGMCIVAGGVIAFSLWTNALRHWKTSEVYLFNNLIPISSTLWARAWLKEPVTPTFWVAMLLIVVGVGFGQTNWQKLFGRRWLPPE